MDEDEVQEPEFRAQEQSSDEGFYEGRNKQEEDDEKIPEAPSKKARKSKVIAKKKARGERTKKETHDKREKQLILAANETAKKIIEEMKSCYEKDLRLYEARKKANFKLRYSNDLQKQLRNVHVCDRFLENGGLEYFQCWLRKLPDGTDSSLTLKKKVFSIMLTLNVSDEHINAVPELKKLVLKSKKNPFLKDLCESIVNRW